MTAEVKLLLFNAGSTYHHICSLTSPATWDFCPDFLLGLTQPACDWATGAKISFQEFSAQSCTKLAGPYLHGPPTENIFKDLSAHGVSCLLH